MKFGLTLARLALVLSGCSGSDDNGDTASEHDPVVIVAGTFSGDKSSDAYFTPLATRLRNDGFDAVVWAIPNHGLGDIVDSAGVLADFVADLLARTGSEHVDIVAHSQGGLVGRYFIENLDGDQEVDSLVSLAAPHYGTREANLADFLGLGSCAGIVSCEQMAVGSAFLDELNDGDDTIGDVAYTNIVTRFDEVVIPYRNGFLHNDGNNTNITLQTQCPFRLVGHVLLPLDGATYTGIVDALEHRPIQFNCWAL